LLFCGFGLLALRLGLLPIRFSTARGLSRRCAAFGLGPAGLFRLRPALRFGFGLLALRFGLLPLRFGTALSFDPAGFVFLCAAAGLGFGFTPLSLFGALRGLGRGAALGLGFGFAALSLFGPFARLFGPQRLWDWHTDFCLAVLNWNGLTVHKATFEAAAINHIHDPSSRHARRNPTRPAARNLFPPLSSTIINLHVSALVVFCDHTFCLDTFTHAKSDKNKVDLRGLFTLFKDHPLKPIRLARVIAFSMKAARSVSGCQPRSVLGRMFTKGEACARLFQSAREGRICPLRRST